MKYIATVSIFLCMIMFSSCTKDSSSSNSNGKLTVQKYGTNESLSKAYETDLSTYTSKVSYWQYKGQSLVQIVEGSGIVYLDTDKYVQLTEIQKNKCPSDVCSSDLNSAESLGIGKNALITPFPDSDTVRDQGERGTCVAFALTGAVELLVNRNEGSDTADISEQNGYFVAKLLTGTWDEAGLVPETTVQLMASNDIPFVDEGYWPYNSYQEDCTYYNKVYSSFYCSETEAQGGGSDNRRQDPHAASAKGVQISEAHQLYASVDRVRQALYRGYPVLLSINANSDFRIATLKGGVVSWVFKVPGCSSGVCGHAVLAIGYQDDSNIQGGGYVIIKNSWGTGWGDNGYAYVTYEWLENSILDGQAIVSVR